MRLRTIATVSLLGAAMVVAPAAPALANCEGVNASQAPVTEPPKDDGGNWMLARFGLGRLPATSDGRGVTVAVLDSGVQASHPALKGRVLSNGKDFLENGGATKGTEDCRGHGTAVASLIAGNARAGFRGIAPGASILPIRVNETVGGGNDDGRKTDDGKIVAAIDYAVNQGADVINISFAYLNGEAKPDKHKDFADAVQRALDKNVVVVAAVGNAKDAKDSFPANLPGVLGVGAISINGQLWDQSTKGSYVDVTAPGNGILTGWTPGIYTEVVGTSFAAPVVAGTVALLKQAHPKWTASQFVSQIQATADPTGGKNSTSYGAGVVDPVRALTEVPAFGAAFKNPPMPLKSDDPQVVAAAQRASDRKALALWLALGGVALTIIVLLSSSIVFNGSRRRWRPAE